MTGPWIQDQEPVFSRDGGHFGGVLKLVFLQPNNPEDAERMQL